MDNGGKHSKNETILSESTDGKEVVVKDLDLICHS
jgi:hypothetical protein